MLSDAKNTPAAPGARVTVVIATEDHERGGRGEVLRLAAGLGVYLHPAFAEALTHVVQDERIIPATIQVEMPQETGEMEDGVAAYVEGRQLALGSYNYVVRLGLAPRAAEIHAARRITAIGNTSLYLTVIDDDRCLGILGIEPR